MIEHDLNTLNAWKEALAKKCVAEDRIPELLEGATYDNTKIIDSIQIGADKVIVVDDRILATFDFYQQYYDLATKHQQLVSAAEFRHLQPIKLEGNLSELDVIAMSSDGSKTITSLDNLESDMFLKINGENCGYVYEVNRSCGVLMIRTDTHALSTLDIEEKVYERSKQIAEGQRTTTNLHHWMDKNGVVGIREGNTEHSFGER